MDKVVVTDHLCKWVLPGGGSKLINPGSSGVINSILGSLLFTENSNIPIGIGLPPRLVGKYITSTLDTKSLMTSSILDISHTSTRCTSINSSLFTLNILSVGFETDTYLIPSGD